ncbi:MAG TPA: lipocalin family protein [Nevskiaceae bacterium]|nr:lipocalin family protein [Nevskiaceae bacterium]
MRPARRGRRLGLVLTLVLALGGCAGVALRPGSTVPLVPEVDLQRYAGDWFVVAHIPTERDADSHNAVENYSLLPDGRIATTYRNRLGGFGGRHKLMTPTARVVPGTGNALWAMRFQIPGTPLVWPVDYEYRIAHLAPDYSLAIIARSQRDYLWIFQRSAEFSEADLERYRRLIAGWGYDASRLQRVPQQWPNPADGSLPPRGPHPSFGLSP